jgi:hypothetical protein
MILRFFVSRILLAQETQIEHICTKIFCAAKFLKKINICKTKKNLITKKYYLLLQRSSSECHCLFFQTGLTVGTVCCQFPRVDSRLSAAPFVHRLVIRIRFQATKYLLRRSISASAILTVSCADDTDVV